MRRYLVFTLLLFPFLLNAQSISLDCGKSSSSFIYTDSNGDKLDNLTSKWGDVLSIRYAHPLSDKFDIGLGLQKNEYGAQSLDSDNKLDWDVSYFGLELDFDYSFNLINSADTSSGSHSPLVAVVNMGFSHSWLTKGMQEIDDRVYDLKDFDGGFNNLIKAKIGVGLLYNLNKTTALSLEYVIHRGLNNMETDNQKLHLLAHHILLGIVIDLKQD